MVQFSVTSPGDKPTPRQKLEQTLEQDRAASEPTRLRIPVHIYDRSTRDYRAVPELAWNLSFTSSDTVEEIEVVIEALGKCLIAIGEQGAETVLAKVYGG
jgi:hypothetical protein